MADLHRRISWVRRERLYKVMPPAKCSGRSIRSQKRCEKWAEVGSNVCGTHGAKAPQVRARANQRIAIAEALLHMPVRHSADVLEETAHVADVLMRQARLELEHGKFTVAKFDALVQAMERASRLAKVNHDAGLDLRKVRIAEAQATLIHKVVTGVMTRLALSVEQRRMLPAAVRAEVEPLLAIEAEPALMR